MLIQLPFSEDVRSYYFPSLVSTDKTKPTGDQLEAVDHLITSMDLMKASRYVLLDGVYPGGDSVCPGGDSVCPGCDSVCPGGDSVCPGCDSVCPGGDVCVREVTCVSGR